jgi:SAM-dependent methyltransferase
MGSTAVLWWCGLSGTFGDRVAAAARTANLGVYEEPSAVGGYVLSRYHAMRRQVAADLLAAAVAVAPAGPVLEIGSSAESLLGRVDPERAVSSDIALGALRQAKGRRLLLDAARSLPLRDGVLAGIVSGELVEHIYDVRAMVGEFHRVLKPGGVLVLTTPNLATLQDRLRFLAGASPRQVDALHPYLHLHIRPFTAGSLRALLATCGFEVLALRSNYVGWQLGPGRWLEWRWPARLFPSLGGSLIVSARRR